MAVDRNRYVGCVSQSGGPHTHTHTNKKSNCGRQRQRRRESASISISLSDYGHWTHSFECPIHFCHRQQPSISKDKRNEYIHIRTHTSTEQQPIHTVFATLEKLLSNRNRKLIPIAATYANQNLLLLHFLCSIVCFAIQCSSSILSALAGISMINSNFVYYCCCYRSLLRFSLVRWALGIPFISAQIIRLFLNFNFIH